MNIQDLNEQFPLKIDPYWKLLKETQLELLESRIIKSQYQLDRAFERSFPEVNIAELIEYQLNKNFTDHIGRLIPTICKDAHRLDFQTFTKEALLILPEQLKHIVEVMIKIIPEDELKKIRNQQ